MQKKFGKKGLDSQGDLEKELQHLGAIHKTMEEKECYLQYAQ